MRGNLPEFEDLFPNFLLAETAILGNKENLKKKLFLLILSGNLSLCTLHKQDNYIMKNRVFWDGCKSVDFFGKLNLRKTR